MRGKKAREQKRHDKVKGNIVEQIVEEMHHVRGVGVQRNAYLPSTRNAGRRREIDVLLTGQVLEYPVRFAFECKNYDRPVDVAKIGEFSDKLQDIGIPPQNGIFVSASGFTVGALDRAKQLGMQTLVLRGLSDDRLGSRLLEALQSVVYLLPVVTKWAVVNDIAEVKPEEMWLWFDAEGQPKAQIPDLLWHRWQEGEPPSAIGVHEVKADPSGWFQRVDGKPVVPIDLRFTVHVYGLVITLAGRANDHRLIDPLNNQMKKRQLNVEFPEPTESLPLRSFDSEEAFRAFMQSRTELVKIVNRVRLPRLLWNGLFWPVSERVSRELTELAKRARPDETITPEQFAELERRSLASVWEPPAAVPPKPPSR